MVGESRVMAKETERVEGGFWIERMSFVTTRVHGGWKSVVLGILGP